MAASKDLVSLVYGNPDILTRLSLVDWDKLIRQARNSGLLARLLHFIEQHAPLGTIPTAARWHFDAATTLAAKQHSAVRWEIGKIAEALDEIGCPIVVLKGGAYVVAGLPAASGRLFNDIDIMVPRELIEAVESALMLAGWHPSRLSKYDQRYYRRWMHEIPPMQHIQRATIIDVHHAILPDTARYHPDSAKLRSRAISVNGMKNIQVLAPEDMLLHSATHLFHDGELPHGLRDLTDLDLLFRHFAAVPGFWSRLISRAEELGLNRPLFYAVRYVQHFLATPIPENFEHGIRRASPNRATLTLMDAIFTRALAPIHESCGDAFTPLARKAAYIRAHWLRMPPHLLFPHLFHKMFIEPRYDPQTI